MSDAFSSQTPKPLPPAPLGPTAADVEKLSYRQLVKLEEDLGSAAVLYDQAVKDSLPNEQYEAMAEGEVHNDVVSESRSALRSFYRRSGDYLYLACNMAVYYPGEPHFDPDLIAVRGVAKRKRSAYVVAKEGKGLDLAVEILVKGDRNKDLVRNVERFAKLGIPEYFVVDLQKRRIHHFLLQDGARRYTPQLGAQGRYRSQVLGLDLMLEEEQLRFYSGTARVPLLEEEVEHLYELVAKEREQAAAAQEQAAAAQERSFALCAQLGEAVLALLRVRGLTLPPEREAEVRGCQDEVLLGRWLSRAASASVDELFLDG